MILLFILDIFWRDHFQPDLQYGSFDPACGGRFQKTIVCSDRDMYFKHCVRLVFRCGISQGIVGVAVATVTSQVVSALIVTGMLLKTREIYVLKISRIRFDKRMLLSVLCIGIPAGLESVMYNISNIVIQVFVNNLGTDTVAAWGTLGKIDAIFWMVINAFAISITTFVGQNFGAGKYHRMRKSVRSV